MGTFRFNLNEVARDEVTGFSGTIIARAQYSHGEITYLLTATDSTGRPVEWWVPDQRLVRV